MSLFPWRPAGTARAFSPRLLHCGAILAPPALFLLLSAAFLWQPLVSGRVLLPSDLVYRADYLWLNPHPPGGATVSQNPLLSDVALYYYPYARYAMARRGAGQFPLWNPYIFAGSPFFAAAQAAILDPINLLTYAAGPAAYWTLAAWLRLAVLGLATYGFLRSLGRTRAAGVAAGSIFMVCGFVAVWLNYSVVTSVVWLPVLLWATNRLLATGRAPWLAATAAAAGCLLLGGHPETQFLVALTWAAYALYSIGPGGRAGRGRAVTPHVLRLGAAAGLGLALGCVQMLPFVAFLGTSNALTERVAPRTPAHPGYALLGLLVQFLPNLGGTPVTGNYWFSFSNFNEQTGYAGLLAVALAVLGAGYWARRDRAVPLFAALALLALVLAIHTPGFEWVRALPLFNVGSGIRWAILWSFAVAVLAGYGIDALPALARKPALTVLGVIAVALATGAAAILALLDLGIRDGLGRAALPPGPLARTLARLWEPTALTVYWPLIFLALGGAVILALRSGHGRVPAAQTALILLLYADLWVFGSRYNPVTPAAAVYPPEPPIPTLQAQLGHERAVGTVDILRSNLAMVFGVRDLRGYEDIVDAPFARLNGPLFSVLFPSGERNLRLSAADQRLLDVGAVRFVMVPRGLVGGRSAAFRLRETARHVRLYENLAGLPRAHIVYSATVAADLPTATRLLLDPGHDPARAVVLTGGGTPRRGPNIPAAGVTWQADDPESIVLSATLRAPGYLVLCDTYSPDWEATVDGAPAAVLRANVAYRAVALSPGAHVVHFAYHPRLVYAAAAISGAASAVVLALALSGLRRSRRP